MWIDGYNERIIKTAAQGESVPTYLGDNEFRLELLNFLDFFCQQVVCVAVVKKSLLIKKAINHLVQNIQILREYLSLPKSLINPETTPESELKD